MTVSVWRIASDMRHWQADDLSGAGAASVGGRWNREGIPVVYGSCSRTLACLETLAHVDGPPQNRYLVEVEIPRDDWDARRVFYPSDHVGWDAEPAGRVSIRWGTEWALRCETLVAEVPSVVVPEESNVLLNPLHPGAGELRAAKVRKWTYDPRLF